MEKISNFRDAYDFQEPKLIRRLKGRIFRCASLDEATKNDVEKIITTYDVRTIIDLRSR